MVAGAASAALVGRRIAGTGQPERQQRLDGLPAEEFDEVGNEQTAFGSQDGTVLNQFRTRRTLQLVEWTIRHGDGGHQGGSWDDQAFHRHRL